MIKKLKKTFDMTIGNVKSWNAINPQVLNQAKKNKNIIYGAQSLKAEMGLYARDTKDWDIFAKKPHQNAIQLTHKLNVISHHPLYYETPSKYHKGTYKVYYVGKDMKPKTEDDVGIADYTKPTQPIKYIVKNGVRYSVVQNTANDKKKSLADPQYAFRHEKDREDLERIQTYQKLKNTPVLNKILTNQYKEEKNNG